MTARGSVKAVLFDLDGTLLDTLHDIATSCNTALARHGLPGHPVTAYRMFVGDGVPALISRVVPEGHKDASTLASVAAAYREEYHRRWNATTRAYAGIPELLDELTRRQMPLAVLSNKPDDFTRRCVAECLSDWTFSMVLGASGAFPHKPDPAGALHISVFIRVHPWLNRIATANPDRSQAPLRAASSNWDTVPTTGDMQENGILVSSLRSQV